MAIQSNPIRVIALVPGTRNLRREVEKLAGYMPTVVTSLSSDRVVAMKAALQPLEDKYIDFSVVDWRTAVTTELSVRRYDARPPSSGLIESTIEEVLRELSPESPFNRVATFPGVHKALVRVLDEFRAWRIDLEDLRTENPSSPLERKLNDLAEISKQTTLTLARVHREFLSYTMQECMSGDNSVPLQQWIVHVGNEIEPLAMQWLQWLAECGGKVTVICDAHPVNDDLFSGSHEWVKLASQSGALFELTDPVGDTTELAKSLFVTNAKHVSNENPKILIRRCPDLLTEAEYAVRDVLRLLEEGVPANKIAILTKNNEQYGPLLEAAALRFGLSLRNPRRVPLLTNPFARLFVQVLESLLEPTPHAFMNLVPTLFPVEEAETEVKEKDEEETSYDAPEEIEEEEFNWESVTLSYTQSEQTNPGVLELLAWREKALNEQATLAGWDELLLELFTQSWCADSVAADCVYSARDRHAHSGLRRALSVAASLDLTKRTSPLDFQQFMRRAKRLWSREEITLPTPEDGVLVCSSSEMIPECDHLLIVGVVEGMFPKRRREEPILADSERAEIDARLKELGTYFPLRNSQMEIRRERDEFYAAVASAHKSLVLSYPEAMGERENLPAHYIHLIEDLVPDVEHQTIKRTSWAPEDSKLNPDKKLLEALKKGKVGCTSFEVQTETTRNIIASGLSRMHIDHLNRAYTCRFQYLVSDRLRIQATRTQTPFATLQYLPSKVDLSDVLDREQATELLENAIEEFIQSRGLAPHQATLLRVTGKRRMAEWVEREFTSREIWPSTARMELEFGSEILHGKAGRTGITVIGKLPNVHKKGDYIIVEMTSTDDPIEDMDAEGALKFKSNNRMRIASVLGLFKKEIPKFGVEVDYPGGRRLIIYPEADYRPGSIHGNNFNVAKLTSLDRKSILEWLAEEFKDIVAKLNEGNVVPDLNRCQDSCFYCLYGELCRRSAEFGETDSFFQLRVMDGGLA